MCNLGIEFVPSQRHSPLLYGALSFYVDVGVYKK